MHQMKSITSNFKNIIGRGGFGIVYKGYMRGLPVAVKVIREVKLLYKFIDLSAERACL